MMINHFVCKIPLLTLALGLKPLCQACTRDDRVSSIQLITLHSIITRLTLTRSLDGSDGQIKTLTFYSDPYHNTNQNPYPNHNPNPYPNKIFDLLPYMAMSRDVTLPKQFLPKAI